MLQFFRNFFKSKIGLGITFLFLGLIAIAFASMDVAGSGSFGGVSGGDRVAVVGKEKIGTADFSRAMTGALDRARQQDPTLTMQAMIEQGGLDGVLDNLVDRVAFAEYARKYGLRAGENLVNSEIVKIQAFQGPDGKFSQDAYQAALAQQGLSDKLVREDIASGLLAQQLITPAVMAPQMPQKVAARYASLLRERRKGALGVVPSTLFAPKGDPTDKQLQSYYEQNRSDYIRPERRVIRYASFSGDNLGDKIEPTNAEIAARYQRDAKQYAKSEERELTQLIVPTQQAANSIRSRVQGGASFETVAREAGFRTSKLDGLTKAQYAEASNDAVANAVFSTSAGQIAEPKQSPLGWHVVRVDRIRTNPGKTLAQARSEIVPALREEKRAKVLADISADIEDELANGTSLSDVANGMQLTLNDTPPLTAKGQVYGKPDQNVPENLQSVVETAFQMEESEPQIAEVERGNTYLIFEVTDITPSAAAPLAEIKPQVVDAWRLSEGAAAAKKASDRILARVAKGSTLAAAIAKEETRLPPPDNIDLSRQELVSRGQNVPPPLALMFSMAEGTAKKLEARDNFGWFLVDLRDISTTAVAEDDPIVASTKAQLAQALGDEYAQALRLATQKELGVERNAPAIEAVRKQLLGEN